jgi:hypothetical protein
MSWFRKSGTAFRECKKRLTQYWTNCFIAGACSVTLQQQAAAQAASDIAAFEYAGLIERKMSTPSGDEQILIGRLEFRFYIDSRKQWAFDGRQVIPMAGREDYESNIASGFDGTDIYSVHYAAAHLNTLTDEIIPTRSISSALHPASVSPAITHFGEDMWGNILWFAFVASQEPNLENIPPLHGALNGKIAGQCYAPQFERRATSGLITNAIWRVIDKEQLSYDNLLTRPNVLMPESSEEVAEAIARISEVKEKMGWREFDSVYSVQLVDDVEGQEYPRRFSISQFTWDKHEPRDRKIATIHGTVTNATRVPVRDSVLPVLHGTQAVVDYRFPIREQHFARNAIRYPLTNSTWIVDTNDFRLQAISEQMRATPIPKAPRPESWTKRMIVVAFGILLLLPVLLRLWPGERRSSHGESQ